MPANVQSSAEPSEEELEADRAFKWPTEFQVLSTVSRGASSGMVGFGLFRPPDEDHPNRFTKWVSPEAKAAPKRKRKRRNIEEELRRLEIVRCSECGWGTRVPELYRSHRIKYLDGLMRCERAREKFEKELRDLNP